MRTSVITSTYLVLLPLTNAAAGLTIDVAGGTADSPPVFVHQVTDPTPLSIEVHLHNESTTGVETVSLWQLSLQVVAGSGATGDLELAHVEAPLPPFLESPGPIVLPPIVLPSSQATIQDADIPLPPTMPGKGIPAGETRDLFTLDFSSPNGAQGTFFLVMGGFDPLGGSVWLGSPPTPMAFANVPGAVLPNEIALAEIVLVIPEPNAAALTWFALTALLGGRTRGRRF